MTSNNQRLEITIKFREFNLRDANCLASIPIKNTGEIMAYIYIRLHFLAENNLIKFKTKNMTVCFDELLNMINDVYKKCIKIEMRDLDFFISMSTCFADPDLQIFINILDE